MDTERPQPEPAEPHDARSRDVPTDAPERPDEPTPRDEEVPSELVSCEGMVAPFLNPVEPACEPADVGPEVIETGSISRDELLGALGSLGDSLSRQLAEIKSAIDRELRAEAAREKVVDRLHAELQEYKRDLLLSMMRPLFLDLILLHDDMGKALAVLSEPARDESAAGDPGPEADPSPSAPRTTLPELVAGFRQAIEDILYRQGVEPYTEEGESFNPRRQRVLSTVPTEDPSLERTVAERIRLGFQAGERVIRPELVAVRARSPVRPS